MTYDEVNRALTEAAMEDHQRYPEWGGVILYESAPDWEAILARAAEARRQKAGRGTTGGGRP